MSGDEKEGEKGLLWNWILSLLRNAASLKSLTVVREGMSIGNNRMDEGTLENGGLLDRKGSTLFLGCK